MRTMWDARAPLVGRERERAELAAMLADARGGRTRFVLLTGEPGIGKTRLADETARDAAGEGFLVLWGCCREEPGAPAFWPWVQILRAALRGTTPPTAPTDTGMAYLAALLPEAVRAPVPTVAALPEEDDRRFLLFDAVARCLRAAAAAAPLLVILDDLHAADEPSLLLMRFLVRELEDAPVVVLGTYRELEAGRGGVAWTTLFGELVRSGRRIPLGGLGEREIATFIAEGFMTTPSPALVRALKAATDGNPFFIDEMVRLLWSQGRLAATAPPADLSVPHGVRAVIRSRLAPLPPDCRAALAAAAVLGRHFDVAALDAVSGVPRLALLGHLEEAHAAGIVGTTAEPLGRYAFTHALIRETLYEDLAEAQRLALHRRAGEALETLCHADLGPHLAEIAHHYARAALTGEVEKAVEFSLQAARRASALLAYEEAVAYYQQALHALALAPAADDARRCTITLAIAETRARAGDREQARHVFLETASLARLLGDATALARAALGLGGPWVEIGTVDVALVGLLDEALERLDPTDETAGLLRARVMARLARELYWSDTPERGVELGDQALGLARRLGDPATLAAALTARVYALWRPDELDERITVESEIVRLAEASGSKEMALRGHLWRLSDCLERGDIEAVERDMRTYERLAQELRQPRYLWYAPRNRAMRALLAGRFAEAEALAQTAFAIGERAHGGLAAQALGLLVLIARWERGELEALADTLADFRARYPGVAAWQCGLAFLLSEQGRRDEARRELGWLARDGFADLHRDATWLLAVALLALACANLDDAGHAQLLYRLLEPYAGRNVVIGRALVCFGAASHYLGVLAATMLRPEAAKRHFAEALVMHERLGARPWLARTQLALARLRAAHGDTAGARPLVAAAAETAAALGMARFAEEVAALARMLAGDGGVGRDASPSAAPSEVASASARDTAPSASTEASFQREGEYWTIAHGGEILRLRDRKGVRYLLELLRHPGRDFHALELVATVARTSGHAAPAAGRAAELGERGIHVSRLGDAGEVLEPVARAAYRRRMHELRQELEEAEEHHDLGRVARARRELEFLGDELARAVGLGGRARRAASSAERARVNVTKQIRAVIARIIRDRPGIGTELRRTVRTGLICRYEPDPRAPVAWRI